MKKFLSHYLGGLSRRIHSHKVFLLGSGLAFSLVICILPLILIIFSLLGVLLESPAVKHQIDLFIETLFPHPETAESVKDIVLARVDEFRFFKTFSGFVGIFGLLLAASGLFSSMRTILNIIFPSDDGKSAIIGKLRDFGMVLLAVGFFLLSVAILPSLNVIINVIDKLGLEKHIPLETVFGFFRSLVFSLASFFLIFMIFFAMYYFIPYARLSKRTVALSAFWAALLWEIARIIFGFYVARAVLLTRVYGTYMFLAAGILWIYYSSVVFILAAEIGQLFRERRQESPKRPTGTQ